MIVCLFLFCLRRSDAFIVALVSELKDGKYSALASSFFGSMKLASGGIVVLLGPYIICVNKGQDFVQAVAWSDIQLVEKDRSQLRLHYRAHASRTSSHLTFESEEDADAGYELLEVARQAYR